jgi:lysophospholipase L1-like esterase
MPLTSRAKWVATGGLTVLALVSLLAAAEGAVRMRQWFKYGHADPLDQLFVVDPKSDLKIPLPRAETRTLRINSLGFRGPEVAPAKPSGRVRLAFLGASTTFCAEASSNETTWPHLVTEALRAAYPDIDYVNAAVPGYGLRSIRRSLHTRVAPLRPDVVVIYEAANELASETRELARTQGLYGESEPGNWLAEHSLLWFLIEKNLRVSRLQREAGSGAARLTFEPADLGHGFAKEMAAVIADAKAIASVVAVPTFSYRIRPEQSPDEQLRGAASALYYMPYMSPELLLRGYGRYNEIIREVARSSGVILIEGALDIPGDDAHFNDTVHFKDAGSRLMAKRVAKALLDSPEFRALIEAQTRLAMS